MYPECAKKIKHVHKQLLTIARTWFCLQREILVLEGVLCLDCNFFFQKLQKKIDQDDLNFCAKPFASFEQMNAPTATIDSL